MSNTECNYFNQKKCQVCNLIDLDYSDQLTHKLNKVKAYFPNSSFQIQKSNEFQSRDKAKFQITGSLDDFKIGFLDSKDLIVKEQILNCPLHNKFINELIHKLIPLVKKYKLNPYDIHNRTGELKGFILFLSPTTNDSYLRFILRSKESLDRLQKIVHDLPEITSISANIQPIPHAILEGEEEVYFKTNKITHAFNGKKLFLSPQGFVQTNTKVAEKLYATATLWTQEIKPQKIADLYCGHGPFSFHLEEHAQEVLGIEVNLQAIQFANESKIHFNYKSNFLAAKTEDISSRLNKFNPDFVVVNPPRAGLKNFTQTLLTQSPNYILYSSCNLETLKLDMDVLSKQYQLQKIEVFDMFPQSEHMEILVLFKKV